MKDLKENDVKIQAMWSGFFFTMSTECESSRLTSARADSTAVWPLMHKRCAECPEDNLLNLGG
jgi:hypothetical protein